MLSAFPQLTESEFADACSGLLHMFRRRGSVQQDWVSVEPHRQNATAYLRITTHLATRADSPPDGSDDQVAEEEEDEDEEALCDMVAPSAAVHYDILLSPVYCVPVLYVSIHDNLHRYAPTMTTLYKHLVPPQFKAQTADVGVMGGITITDHPATNRPVYFIHPCQTAGVMEASVDGNITAQEYLMIWIGSLGKSVGLDVPFAL
ncbi:hypothetical protein BDW02DRAFT_517158, partial [Decorospora gaudefroyi]